MREKNDKSNMKESREEQWERKIREKKEKQ